MMIIIIIINVSTEVKLLQLFNITVKLGLSHEGKNAG
jgi:hypothetical protein